jgi:uncharacterized protein YbaA (DUF1428 family)
MPYFDGFVAAVPTARKDAYKAYAEACWEIFKDHGAVSMIETWGDDVPKGELTSFPLAVKLEEGESVVFSWIEWPDKATRDAGGKAIETDARLAAMGAMPFDGKRLIFGGFTQLVRF